MICDFITKSLPESVAINGVSYPINWDFRAGIQFDEIMRSGKSEEQKLLDIFQIYFRSIPDDIGEAFEKIIWFYRCGEKTDENEEDAQRRQRYKRRQNGPAYSFSQDAAYIYAAFKEQYGIDLTDNATVIHWWKFVALFESLGEDTKMSQIMYYRQANTSGMDKERRAYVNEMKKLYRIRDSEGVHKLTLNERNQRWKDYVKERHNNMH